MKTIPPPPVLPSRFRFPANGVGAVKPSANYAVGGAWLCHAGRLRRINEDACLVGNSFSRKSDQRPFPISVPRGPWIVAVSDGIGGHAGGAEASREVIAALAECKRVTPVNIADTLQRVNRHLCERGRGEPNLAGMGATVAGIGCGRRGIFAFNVGDSRVYKQVGGSLVQITRDDSEAEDLIDHGLLEPYEGRRPGYLHALTQAIGGREHVVKIVPHIHPLQITARARFVICSDGLSDMLTASEMEKILAVRPEIPDAVAGLFQGAMDAGGADNITIAMVDVARTE